METKIKDLITLPEVRTVVQLSDISDPSLQEGLKTGFVFTEDVFTNLTILLDQIISGQGVGIFLQGNYGSGKSHFLSILSLLISQPDTWDHFLKKEKGLTEYYIKTKEKRFLPVNISLVSHASREPLEAILCSYLNQALASLDQERKNALFFDPSASRLENFDKLPAILKTLTLDGIVILIDELSEFLRSKSDGRSFNEDIRFLQFLGEYSQKHPLWVIASLQERLEEIGAINEESFNKIKDRYPIRLFLTAEHIEALIKKRLIIKKEGASGEINRLYASFKEAFPRLDISKDTFYDLYPVHPYTLAVLDELKFLFSQKRGIVDFIHYQIKGDSSRKIAGIMEKPADSLLGPEYIFDHFLVRLRETTKTRMYYQTVYGYYARELNSFFPDKESRSIAQRLIKILLLKAFSPYKKGSTIRELGEMILCTVSSLDSSVNYRFLADIMERLYREGAYIGFRKGDAFCEDIYYIDLKEDIQGIIRQKSDYIRQGLLPDDERIFDCLSEWIDDPALPLARLKRKAQTKGFIKWQYTTREGFVYVKSCEETSPEELKGLYEEYKHEETDFFLFIGKLSATSSEDLCQKHLSELKEMGENLPFIFWIPGYPHDDKELRGALVYYLLLEKYKEDFTDTGRRIHEYLSSSLQERKERITELFRQAYFDGELIYFNREGIKKVNEIGILPFDKMVQRIISPCLNHLCPLHKDISPLSDYFVRETLVKTIEGFFRQGEITFEPGMDKGIEILIEGYLKPLKVVKQVPRGFKLNADPGASAIVSVYLDHLKEGRISLEALYLSLRKGAYGLSRNHFEMLTLAMLFSGQVRGFASGREVNLQRPDFVSIWCIEEIGEGELIDELLRDILMQCPLIPQKMKKAGFSFVMQQKAWDALIEAKRAWSADEERFLQALRYSAGYKCLAHIDLKRTEEDFFTIKALFHEIRITYPAKEGLELFLAYYRNTAFMDEVLRRLERFRNFIANDLDIYANIFSYMTDPALVIPEPDEYAPVMDLKEEVNRLLFNKEKIFEEGFIDEMVKTFNRFKDTYTFIYQKEHQKVKSPDTFTHYLRIKEGLPYNILARISKINIVSVEDDLVKVNKYIAEIGTMICKGLDLDQLRKRPICSCGFKLGDTFTPIPIKQIEETIDKGIIEYVDALKEPRYREQIISYAVSLRDVGKGKEAEGLRKILDLSLQHEGDIHLLDKMLTDKLINGLNEAFEGKAVFIKRDIHELLENIVDRNFPKDKLISIFTEWLNKGEDLSNDVYIKIRYKAPGLKNHEMTEMACRIFPELIPLIKDIGEYPFQHLLVTTVWAAIHNLPMENILQTFRLSSLSDLDTFREKCRKVFDSFKRQKGEGILHYLDAAEQFIVSQQINTKLLDILAKEATEEALLEELFYEYVFTFSAKGITSLLIKRLWSEREPRRINRIHKMLMDRKDKVQTAYEGKDNILERIGTKRYIRLLDNVIHFLRALEWLDGARLSEFDSRMWEKAFIEHGARFEIAAELVKKDLRDLDMTDSLSLKPLNKEKGRFISAFQDHFSDYIEREYTNLIQPQARADSVPLFINALRYDLYERYRKKLNPGQTHFLLIDGMRWDIWSYCQDDIVQALQNKYRIVDQRPLWVFLPSTTLSQLDPFITGEPPSKAHVTEKDIQSSIIMEEHQSYGPGRNITGEGFLEIIPEKDNIFTYKYSFIDDKIHTSHEDLITIYDEIKLKLLSALKGYMDNLPEKSMVILFSDHGFVRKKAHPYKSVKTSPYSHGRTSPWEMIVPMVVLYRWM
jgi:hypothetical protein